jgi:hypothetical protein
MSAILGDIVTRLAVDRREWTNGLSQSARDAAKFGNSVTGELRTVERQIAALSRAYAAGAKVNKAELDALAARHQSLTRQIEAGKALANNLLGRGSDLPEAGPSAASLRVRRTEEQQLARVRTLLQEVAAEEVRTGQSRATQIERLVRLEGSLASAIERRKTLVQNTRDAQFIGPMPAEAAAQSVASQRVRRSEEEQLKRVRSLIQEVAAEEVRTGQSRSGQIERLIRLEQGLASAIERRQSLVDQTRQSLFIGPMPAEAASPSIASQRVRRSEEEQLKRVRQLIGELATEEARTGESRAHQIDRLIRLESQLIGVKERAKSLEQSRRDAAFIGPMPAAAVAPSALSQRSMRSDEQQLAGVRARMQELAATYQRTGQQGGHQLDRLARLEAALTARIAARAQMLDRARDRYVAAGTAANLAGGVGMSGGQMALTAAAYGISDAATAAQFGGAKAAALSLANNLPMLGMGLADVGKGMAEAGGKAAGFGAALAKFAGPAGLVASVALPLGTLLIPKLTETEKKAKDAKKGLDEFADAFANIDRVSRDHERFRVGREEGKAGTGRQTGSALTTSIVAARRDLDRLAIEETNIRAKRATVLAKYGLNPEIAHGISAPTSDDMTPALSALASHQRNNPGGRTLTEDDRKRLVELDRALDDVGSRQSAGANRIEDLQTARRNAAERERNERLEKDRKDWQETLAKNRRDQREAARERADLAIETLSDIDPRAGEFAEIERRRRERLADVDSLFAGPEADRLRAGVNSAAEQERTRLQKEILKANTEGNREVARLLQEVIDALRLPSDVPEPDPVFR